MKNPVGKKLKSMPILVSIFTGVCLISIIGFSCSENEYPSIMRIHKRSNGGNEDIRPLKNYFKINCTPMLDGDKEVLHQIGERRILYDDSLDFLSMKCEDIKKRGYYAEKASSLIEEKFPIAYARNIYSDYYILELSFLISYAPQNHYCFVIDKKQDIEFHRKMEALSACFPNIYLIENTFELQSNGLNAQKGFYSCIEKLADKPWKYILLLQNDDLPLKTNRELVEILTIFNGTVDAEFADIANFRNSRVDINKNWTYSGLNIFKKNDIRLNDKEGMNKSILFQKGYSEAALSRAAADYIVNTLNISTFLDQVNDGHFGSDEMVWPTLFGDDFLDIPGHIDKPCMEKTSSFRKNYILRKTFWFGDVSCIDGLNRNGQCVLSSEQLNSMKKWPYLFANKFKKESDFGGVYCWSEYLYNRTYYEDYHQIDSQYYSNLPLVLYNNMKGKIKDKRELCEYSLETSKKKLKIKDDNFMGKF